MRAKFNASSISFVFNEAGKGSLAKVDQVSKMTTTEVRVPGSDGFSEKPSTACQAYMPMSGMSGVRARPRLVV